MQRKISLGETWDGRNDRTDLSGIALLVPVEVHDADMSCGGREDLDSQLRLPHAEKRPLPCARCAVKSVCAFGPDLG